MRRLSPHERPLPDGVERRRWPVVLIGAFLVYVALRMIEMTVWLVRWLVGA